jgi:hypothetical protein
MRSWRSDVAVGFKGTPHCITTVLVSLDARRFDIVLDQK